MSYDDQETEVAGILRGSGLIGGAIPLVGECPSDPASNVICGLFQRKPSSKVRGRTHTGSGSSPPSSVTYHSMLSSLDAEGGLNLVDCTWPAGTHVPPHIHAGEDELLIVLSGIVEVRVADRTFRCGAGETVYIPRGTGHEMRALTEARHIAILTRKSLERPRMV